MTPAFRAYDLQDRTDRRVDLGIHQHDVLAVLESFESDMRAEFDGAGRIDDDIHVLRAAQQQRILGRHRSPGSEFSRRAAR